MPGARVMRRWRFSASSPRGELYELLAPFSGQLAATNGVVVFGSIAWALGTLAATAERYEQAEGHFAAAAEIEARVGAPRPSTRARLEYARLRRHSSELVMDCPSCGHLNREGARFCAQCATPLSDRVTCPSCGTAHPSAARHCDSCGQALSGEGASAGGREGNGGAAMAAGRDPRAYTPEHLAERIRGSRADLEGERKQVTVLFADVIGSMDLAERTDAEVWRRIMDRFFVILCDGVHRFEGTVDKFTGDGIMALFGAPLAHEDHAQRACWAALTLHRELAVYAAEVRRGEGLSFSVRMGLNSGEVIVGAIGEDLRLEYTAIGHTVGLAQRMESLAEPGRAYLTDQTAKLVSGYLDLDDLGEFDVKGVGEPVRVHALAGAGGARSRLDISRARGFTRFVGREDELATLQAALEQSREGQRGRGRRGRRGRCRQEPAVRRVHGALPAAGHPGV